ESGAGKSLTGLAILGLLPDTASITQGKIIWEGSDILIQTKSSRRKIRGKEIGMVFQEPSSSMNPTFSVGSQLSEVLRVHRGKSRRESKKTALALMQRVKIHDHVQRFKSYPHELSGGMLQRKMIAIAIASRPKLLIADEATTALDASVQRQILELIADLQEEYNMSLLLITHNLGLVAEMADRVLVMKQGKVIETASVYDLFKKPEQIYTRELLKACPGLSKN
ncbi:MAG: ABC transporter ATP-binding protein, partial [Opitutaceae bacterium]|nr:ABC transporter ATP-binding protein [Opitutaceae bacterium]